MGMATLNQADCRAFALIWPITSFDSGSTRIMAVVAR